MDSLFDISLEQSVLTTLIGSLDDDIYTAVDGLLDRDDFFHKRHKLIFDAVSDLAQKNQPHDVVMVLTELQNKGVCNQAGGEEYLMELLQRLSSSRFHLESYAKQVKELSKRRAIFNKLKEAQESLLNLQQGVDDVWDGVSSSVNDVLSSDISKTSYDSTEAYELWFDDLCVKSQSEAEAGVKTGFSELDKKAVVNGGDVVIIAARSGMGKTTLSQNIFSHIAQYEEGTAVYFSIEMSAKDLTARLYADKSNITMKKAFTGKDLNGDDWDGIMEGAKLSQQLNFRIDDRSQITIGQMRSMLNKTKQETGKISAVFVDYLQLITPSNPNDMRERQVSLISAGLKAIAKDFDCPVFALSQLNRSLESRPNKRPMMSDLRESGSIEQDASVILFIYRDEVYNPDSEAKGTAELIIGKNRNGEKGTAIVGFEGQYSRFTNNVIANEFQPFMEGGQ